MKIVSVVGARPQFVKAAMVSRHLRAIPDVDEIIVHTGQHYDTNMSQVFFSELQIPEPAFNLGVGSGAHGVQTGRMLEGIEAVLLQAAPDWVLVYGDTNSTLAGAVAASKLGIRVAHVEAGLRSFNRQMPEEINRVIADHVSDLLFTPTALATSNLIREGIKGDMVYQAGDVMYDAALYYGCRAERTSHILERLKLAKSEYILATIHRAENTSAPKRIRAILMGLSRISDQIRVILPIHPRTRKVILREHGSDSLKGIEFMEPVGYLDMIMLERNARLIATDSGGVQKEAFFFSVPCVTLRTETEWQELIEMGWNRLAPPSSDSTVMTAILEGLAAAPRATQCPYGDGDAAVRISMRLVDSHHSTLQVAPIAAVISGGGAV